LAILRQIVSTRISYWKARDEAIATLSRIRQRMEELERDYAYQSAHYGALEQEKSNVEKQLYEAEAKLSEQSGLAELGRLAKVWAESEAHVSEIGSRVRHHLSKQEKK
jgi:hypothetical protein